MHRIAAAIFIAAAALLSAAAPAIAQLPGGPAGGLIQASCGGSSLNAGQIGPIQIDTTGKLCVNATVTATVSPFTPSASGARGTPITVTTSDSSGTLPTNNTTVVVTNTGTTNPMYCNVNGVAATTSDQYIAPSGGFFTFGIPATITTLHCIATGGSTTANMVGGSGLAAGTGGGSGGTGGVAQGSTTSGQLGTLIQGAVTTAAPSYTTAQTSPLSLDTAGNLRVNVVAGGGSGGTSSTFGAAFPGTGTAVGFTDGTNMVAGIRKAASTDVAFTDPAVVVADRSFGNVDDASCTAPCAGNNSGIGLLKGVNALLNTLNTNIQLGTQVNGAAFNLSTGSIIDMGCYYATSYAAASSGTGIIPQCDSTGHVVIVGQGTAGTAAGGVLTIQGVASMTKLLVTPDALPAGTANIGQVGGSVNITPTDCSIALTTGGAAQNIITAGATLHGFTIANIDTSAGSGEPVWMSFTGTAVASAIASYPLAAPTATTFAGLSSYTTPLGFGTNANVSVIAATTGHKISCTKW